MTKAELTERIIDALVDPYTDDPEDYLYCTPIDKYGAADLLEQIIADEVSEELSPDERLPKEVTPELMMEIYNCLVRARKHEVRVQRLAEYITDAELVCEYVNYYYPTHDDAIDMFPVEFLDITKFSITFGDDVKMSALDLIKLGQRSTMFHADCEYCYYDKERDQLFSTDCPFRDGTLDATAFAEFILSDAEAFGYIFDDIMTDDEAKHVLGCTKEEYINEQF